MPGPLLIVPAWQIATMIVAGIATAGGTAAVLNREDDQSGTDLAAGAAQAGTQRPDNQTSADIFADANQRSSTQQTIDQQNSTFGPSGGVTDELSALLGVDLSGFGIGGFDLADEDLVRVRPDDGSVSLTPGDVQLSTGIDPGQLSQEEQVALFREQGSAELPLEQVARRMFALQENPAELVMLQQKLFASGYYGGTDYDELRWGVVGPETIDAFNSYLRFASTFRTRDGQRLPWEDLLDRLVEASGGLRQSLEGAIADAEPKVNVTLSDPSSLVSILDAVSQRETGKKASSEAKRKFVAVMHGLQRNSQVAAQTGQGGINEVVSPSSEGQAQAMVQQDQPEDVLGFQTLQAYNGLLSMIGGSSG